MFDEKYDLRDQRAIRHLKRGFSYLAPHKTKLSVVILGSVIFSILKLVDPYLYKLIFDRIFVRAYVSNINTQDAVKLLGVICAIFLVNKLLQSALYGY